MWSTWCKPKLTSEKLAAKYRQRRVRIQIGIDEKLYSVDLELLDRYTAFSTEIARLSLAALAALGAAFSLVVKDGKAVGQLVAKYSIFDPLPMGIVFLCLAAGVALAHRYFATDGFSDYVQALRRLQAPEAADDPGLDRLLDCSSKLYKSCTLLLIFATAALVLGVVCLTVGAPTLLRAQS